MDPTGEVKGIVIHVIDIDERKQAERVLQETKQQVRLATEATGVGIWTWNVLTNEIRWDEQMFRIYGFTPDLEGLELYKAWSNAVLPEDLPNQEQGLQKSIRSGIGGNRQFRICRPGEKDWRYIENVEIARKNGQGETEWLIGTNLDITDRKTTELVLIDRENELQLIINSMPALIAYVDPEFRYLRANSTYFHWLGIPAENIVGQKVNHVVGEAAWQKIKPYMEKAMSGEQVHYELQMPYKTAPPRWIHANYVPDKDTDGNVKGIVALIVDIGEIKQAEMDIAKLNKSLLHRVEELQAIFDTAPIGIAIADDPEAKAYSWQSCYGAYVRFTFK